MDAATKKDMKAAATDILQLIDRDIQTTERFASRWDTDGRPWPEIDHYRRKMDLIRPAIGSIVEMIEALETSIQQATVVTTPRERAEHYRAIAIVLAKAKGKEKP